MDLLISALLTFGSLSLLIYMEIRGDIKKYLDDRWREKCARRKIII
jgi:hypothetical protein